MVRAFINGVLVITQNYPAYVLQKLAEAALKVNS